MQLIVFLGNPGHAYAKTRHNTGFRIAQALYPDARWQSKFHARFAMEDGRRLLMPQTFMNLSGISVGEAYAFFHLQPEEILVVHDDIELPFGTIRLQLGGGLQGHNGLRSIKDHIGSDRFARLRVGVGRPVHGPVASFVLQPFTDEEESVWPLLLEPARRMLETSDRMPQEYRLPSP